MLSSHIEKRPTLPDVLRAGMAGLLYDIIFLYRLLRHPHTPWHVKSILAIPVLYLCSPIQLIPNFIPVLGQMDDVLLVWITKRLVRRLVDRETWQDCRQAAVSTRLLAFSRQHAHASIAVRQAKL